MSEINKKKELLGEIKTFISFAVIEEDQGAAIELVERFKDDSLIQRLFFEHYSALPDAIEEPVVKVYELAVQRGVYCLLLEAKTTFFIYLISVDEVVYAGRRVEDLSDDLISFIGHGDREKFGKLVEDLSNFTEYSLEKNKKLVVCPACGVSEGESHVLGCVAEVCPWCDGQLSNCNCRFEKMEIDEFTREDQLEAFEEMLEEEGRIPFASDQKISYPGMSEGLDKN